MFEAILLIWTVSVDGVHQTAQPMSTMSVCEAAVTKIESVPDDDFRVLRYKVNTVNVTAMCVANVSD